MIPFLEKISERLLSKFPNNLHNVKVVLPSKRASIFLKSHISKKINKAVFLPEIISIEDFLIKISDLQILDNISLQFMLYEIYSTKKGNSAESFDEFINWSNIVLNDFNEIDKNLIDPKMIFMNLKQAKDLDKWLLDDWSFSESKLSKMQDDYISFYEGMYEWYDLFQKKLLSENLAYQGLAYRIACEKIDQYSLNADQIWFVGLNALTKSEQNIIDYFKQKDIARVFWDADEFYYENTIHEAGDFLRRQRNKWHEIDFKGVGNYWSVKKDQFNIIECPKNIAQVKVAGEILSKIKEDELSDTAVVLSDESLLLPLLHHLPSNVKKLNVTMGSPIKETVLFSFLQSLFKMQINAHEYNKQSLYYKDVLEVIEHSVFLNLTTKNISIKIKEFVIKNKIIFFDSKTIELLFSKDDLSIFFNLWGSSKEAALCLENIIELYFSCVRNQRNIIDSQVLVAFKKIIILLNNLISKFSFEIKLQTLHYIFNNLIADEKIPYQGEPLEGVQIMGILETRTLDFKNIIMLSVNEGVLPKSKSVNTFIPYDIKKYFNLPTYLESDALFSYHFYRLLQRAKNISLIYNSEVDGFGNGEKSRFITQLMSEYKKGKINELIYNGKISSFNQKKEVVKIQNNNLKDDLQKYFQKGVSPSSLNMYNKCSLSFYLHYIAKIRPENEFQEFSDAKIIGNSIHKSLETHYRTGDISEKFIDKKTTEILQTVENYFYEELNIENVTQGKNYINLMVAKQLMRSFLKLEHSILKRLREEGKKIKIIAIEQKLQHSILINGFKINLIGFADRVDIIEDQLRIIDYKTGFVDQKELVFNSIDELFKNTNKQKAFQLLMYIYLYYKMNPSLAYRISGGIYSFKNTSSGILFLSNKSKSQLNIDEDLINEFEKQLMSLLMRITKEDFIQTAKKDSYEWDAYKLIYKG